MTDPQRDLVHAVDQLRASLDQLRDELVRKDVFFEVQRNIDTRFANVNERVTETVKDIDALDKRFTTAETKSSKDKWLLLTSLVFPALIGILLLYVATQIGGSPT